MSFDDRTQRVESVRFSPSRPSRLAWLLLAITLAGGGLTGWILWEQGRLARDEASATRERLLDANQRAATAEGEILALAAARMRPTAPVAEAAAELVSVAASLREAIDKAAGEVALDDAAAKVVITLDDPDLFRAGDAELTRRGDTVIVALAKVLVAAGDRTLWVNGHVDDAPLPEDAAFDSAWELSAARALAVVQRLADEGVDARRLAAVAFGAERPASQDRAKNRRIEIVVEGAPPLAAARTAATRSR